MNTLRKLAMAFTSAATLMISACGGGGGDQVASGGVGGTGISAGAITAIGSVTVNGVTFDTTDAAIFVEGTRVDDPDQPDGDEAGLRGFGLAEGQVVQVEGSIDANGVTGTAESVFFNDSVEGPITSVISKDTAAGTAEIVVLGQTVYRE